LGAGVLMGLNWIRNAWVRRRALAFYDNVIVSLEKYKPIIERELGIQNFEFPSIGASHYYVRIQEAQMGRSPFVYLELPAQGLFVFVFFFLQCYFLFSVFIPFFFFFQFFLGTKGSGKLTVVGQVMDFRLVKEPTPTNRFLLRQVSLSYLSQSPSGGLDVKSIDLDAFPEDITIVDAQAESPSSKKQ